MDFHSLSVKERLRIIEAIWESIAAEPGQPDLTDSQRAELERRWADDEANPGDVIPWETVLAEARARSRK
jgi:putative addiction module component (TIGR02574 family)